MAERITIVIETGNAAFEESPTGEVSRILRKVAAEFRGYGLVTEKLRDVNGNVVGQVTVEEIE